MMIEENALRGLFDKFEQRMSGSLSKLEAKIDDLNRQFASFDARLVRLEEWRAQHVESEHRTMATEIDKWRTAHLAGDHQRLLEKISEIATDQRTTAGRIFDLAIRLTEIGVLVAVMARMSGIW